MDRGQTPQLLCLSKVKMPLWNVIGEEGRGDPTVGNVHQEQRDVSQHAGAACSRNVQSLLLWDKHGGGRSMNRLLQCQIRDANMSE